MSLDDDEYIQDRLRAETKEIVLEQLEEFHEKCIHYYASRSQRTEEKARRLNNKGTMGYENTGCFCCGGYNTNCKSYYVIKKK